MIATAYRNAMIADAPLKWPDTFMVPRPRRSDRPPRW